MKKFALTRVAAAVGHTLHDMLFRHMARNGFVLGLDSLDPVAVKAALDAISASVKEEGAKALAEAEKAGQLSQKTKDIVDGLLTKQGAMMLELTEVQQKLLKSPHNGPTDNPDSLDSVLAKEWPAMQKEFMGQRSQSKSVQLEISRKALTNSGVTGAALNFPGTQVLVQPLAPLLRRLTVRDLLAQGKISKAVLFYLQETGFTNNAAPVSEGSLKPKSDLTFALITDPVRTLAHLFDISLQMLDDIDFIQSYIQTRGMYGLKLVEENQLLMGSGTGQNLLGLYTQATAYNLALDLTVNPATATDIDKIRLAMLQVELAFAQTTGMILHPTDWAGIELTKDLQNRYIFANPQQTTTGTLWGRPVVSTQAMTQGKFLVGDFEQHAQIFDRQDANIAISYENKDNFERNMATIRIEERLALAVYRPEAFVKGTLESAS